MTDQQPAQQPPAEVRYAAELAFLRQWDTGPRPPGWLVTPKAAVLFACGSNGDALRAENGQSLEIAPKFVGDRALVQRAVVTLSGLRGLLLVGEPGTAKSLLSELLAAAISGNSLRTVQGTAGTHEDHLRYSWNYALLLAKGPCPQALVPSPVLAAMRAGAAVRIEEITRCLPEVQDALVSVLSDRRMAVPELADDPDHGGNEAARPGFCVIATANLRDKGVAEMSAALKRRFNFETVQPIADLASEISLVQRQAGAALQQTGAKLAVDGEVLRVLVTIFRDLRSGRSDEGWAVDRPASAMSTAEAVAVAASLGAQTAWFGDGRDPLALLPGYLLGAAQKDDPKDRARLLAYWDGAVKRRAEAGASAWQALYAARGDLAGQP